MSTVCDQITPVNSPDLTVVGDSSGDLNLYLAASKVIPALETRLDRYSLASSRIPTIRERPEQPWSRFSVDELIRFLNDAAITVASRVKALYLSSLKVENFPSLNTWNFDNDLRVLASTIKIDGSRRASRISGDKLEDVRASNNELTDTEPVVVIEGGDVDVYGNIFRNPITSELQTIKVPLPISKSCNGTFNTSTSVFTRTDGDDFDILFHTLTPIKLTNNVGDFVNGIITNISGNTVTLDIETNFTYTNPMVATWETPGFSCLHDTLFNVVVEGAAVDCFAALPDIGAMRNSLNLFENEMSVIGLQFFQLQTPKP